MNYDFVSLFEVKHTVSNESIDLETILDCLRKALSEQKTREIINHGIEYYCNKIDNFNIIKLIQHQFSSINLIKDSDINDNKKDNNISNKDCYYMFETFDIQEVVCKIFQFLDFQSLIQCRKVNRQWMKDSYQPLSIYHVNTCNLFGSTYEDGYGARESHVPHYRNISAFKSARFVEIHPWSSSRTLKDYFQLLKTQFCKINQLSILPPSTRQFAENDVTTNNVNQFVDTINCILKNNMNGIETLSIENEGIKEVDEMRDLFVVGVLRMVRLRKYDDSYSINNDDDNSDSNEFYLKNLKNLHLRQLTVDCCLIKFNFENLCVLSLDLVWTRLQFWQQLMNGFCGSTSSTSSKSSKSNSKITNRCNNLKKLSFNRVYVSKYEDAIEQLTTFIIPSLASAMGQIETFECYDSQEPWLGSRPYNKLSCTLPCWIAYLSNVNINDSGVHDHGKQLETTKDHQWSSIGIDMNSNQTSGNGIGNNNNNSVNNSNNNNNYNNNNYNNNTTAKNQLQNLRLDIDFLTHFRESKNNYKFNFDQLKNVNIKLLNVLKRHRRRRASSKSSLRSNVNILAKILYQDSLDEYKHKQQIKKQKKYHGLMRQRNTISSYGSISTPISKSSNTLMTNNTILASTNDAKSSTSTKAKLQECTIEKLEISWKAGDHLSGDFLFSNVFILDLISYKHLKYVRIGKLAEMKSFDQLVDTLESFDQLHEIMSKNIANTGNYSNDIVDVEGYSNYNLYLNHLHLDSSSIALQSVENTRKLTYILTKWYESNIVYVCISFTCKLIENFQVEWLKYTSNWVQSLITNGKSQVNQSIRPIEIISNGVFVQFKQDESNKVKVDDNNIDVLKKEKYNQTLNHQRMSQMFIEDCGGNNQSLHISIEKIPFGKEYSFKRLPVRMAFDDLLDFEFE